MIYLLQPFYSDNKTMNCIAVDDEPLALELLEGWISNVPFLELKGTFRTTWEAYRFVQDNPVDLIFLDINMPALSGIQLTKLLREEQLVIFTTAYSQYAIESYELNAVDYLLKPIEFGRFLKAAQRAKEIFDLRNQSQNKSSSSSQKRDQKENNLFIKSGRRIFNIEIDKIKYIEASGSYVIFVTESKKHMCLQNMDEALNSLPAENFARVHKSYIVSLKHIEKIEDNQIKIGDITISIGRTYRENFFRKINS